MTTETDFAIAGIGNIFGLLFLFGLLFRLGKFILKASFKITYLALGGGWLWGVQRQAEAPSSVDLLMPEGKYLVSAVFDGDTVEVKQGQNAYRIRLAGIDAPEHGQEYAEDSTEFLKGWIEGEMVHVVPHSYDTRWDRQVAWIIEPSDNVLVNIHMVSLGLAYWYEDYAPDSVELKEAQKIAQKRKINIWSGPDLVRPWVFRRNQSLSQIA